MKCENCYYAYEDINGNICCENDYDAEKCDEYSPLWDDDGGSNNE